MELLAHEREVAIDLCNVLVAFVDGDLSFRFGFGQFALKAQTIGARREGAVAAFKCREDEQRERHGHQKFSVLPTKTQNFRDRGKANRFVRGSLGGRLSYWEFSTIAAKLSYPGFSDNWSRRRSTLPRYADNRAPNVLSERPEIRRHARIDAVHPSAKARHPRVADQKKDNDECGQPEQSPVPHAAAGRRRLGSDCRKSSATGAPI